MEGDADKRLPVPVLVQVPVLLIARRCSASPLVDPVAKVAHDLRSPRLLLDILYPPETRRKQYFSSSVRPLQTNSQVMSPLYMRSMSSNHDPLSNHDASCVHQKGRLHLIGHCSVCMALRTYLQSGHAIWIKMAARINL